jgi:hypothetical protein
MLERFVESYENLPLWVRLVLALPGLNGLSGGLYRFALKRSLLGLVWLLLGGLFLWPIDLASLLVFGRLRVGV